MNIANHMYDKKIWDVSVLELLCPIEPLPVSTTSVSTRLTLRVGDILTCESDLSNWGEVAPIEVSMTQPQVSLFLH